MIPSSFEYVRAASLEHALDLLNEHGDRAKLLAGGHSLLPLMKLRLAAPEVVVDIGRLSELSYVGEGGDYIAIGALTTHDELSHSPLIAAELPVLGHVAGQIGDPQVRHRGTIGGSLAHGDPASDLPAVVLALGGTLVLTGPSETREVPATEFHMGFLETAVAPDEILTEIRLPKMGDGGWGFEKLTKRAQDWAIVGAVAVRLDGNGSVGVGLINVGPVPTRASSVEAAVASGASAAGAAAQADAGIEVTGDLNASEAFRRHLSRVLVERALDKALA
ncbi:MAG TPA: xanthine dehydrogenase family protein subunit M [Acidimicrobiales bacterium]|nr:xanthine dehydrogenase family protein subunit M [Acidimicrobiales bacterium]